MSENVFWIEWRYANGTEDDWHRYESREYSTRVQASLRMQKLIKDEEIRIVNQRLFRVNEG